MSFKGLACWATIALSACSTSAFADSSTIDPHEVIEAAFNNLYGFNSVQQVEISAGSAEGRKFTRSAQVIRVGAAGGLNRMLVRFSGPADLRGVGILLLERENFQYDAFMYQPIVNKVRRVSLYQRNDKFFGTDLSFEDLEGKRPSQWSARLLRSDRKYDRMTWVIEMKPIGFPSGYERIIGWFDQQVPVVVHFEYFLNGQESQRHKIVDLDPAQVVEKGGYFIPTHLKFSGSRGSETVVRISQIEIRESFPGSRFSPTALERGTERTDAAETKDR